MPARSNALRIKFVLTVRTKLRGYLLLTSGVVWIGVSMMVPSLRFVTSIGAVLSFLIGARYWYTRLQFTAEGLAYRDIVLQKAHWVHTEIRWSEIERVENAFRDLLVHRRDGETATLRLDAFDRQEVASALQAIVGPDAPIVQAVRNSQLYAANEDIVRRRRATRLLQWSLLLMMLSFAGIWLITSRFGPQARNGQSAQ